MHAVENPAGRLVTFRIVLPISDENSANAGADLRAMIGSSKVPVVVVTDLSAARTFAPETTQRFVAVMKADNPRVDRSAVLLPHNAATLGMQVARMVKEAAHPARRLFTEPRAVAEWLAEALTDDERGALDRFLETIESHPSSSGPASRIG